MRIVFLIYVCILIVSSGVATPGYAVNYIASNQAELQAALTTAAGTTVADRITLTSMTGTIVVTTTSLSYSDTPTPGGSLTIEGNGQTLEGSFSGATCVLTALVQDSSSTITIRNLTITDGTDRGLSIITDGAVVLENVVVRNSTMTDAAGAMLTGGGGALIVSNGSGSIGVSGCRFEDNDATIQSVPPGFAGGGGLLAYAPNGSVTLETSFFTENELIVTIPAVMVGGGGAGVVGQFAPVLVTGCEFNSNHVTFVGEDVSGAGGGLAVSTVQVLAGVTITITIEDSFFQDNTVVGSGEDADVGGGGAAVYTLGPTTNVVASQFIANSASATGDGGDAAGGGLVIIDEEVGDSLVANCVFSANVAGATQATGDEYVTGGGLEVRPISGTATLVNNTVVGNLAESYFCELGGGISVSLGDAGSIGRVYNNIVRGNTLSGNAIGLTGGADMSINTIYDNSAGATAELYNNDLGDDSNFATPTTFADPLAGTDLIVANPTNYTHGDNITLDPQLGAGFHLVGGTPCIDTGTNSAPQLPTTDFEGDARMIDGDNDGTATADIGADEFDPNAAIPTLSEWGQILLVVMLGISALWMKRRRSKMV